VRPASTQVRFAADRVVALARGRSPALWLAVSLAGYLVVCVVTRPQLVDLLVYRGEGAALRHGVDPYTTLYRSSAATPTAHATYPPFAVLLFAGLTLVPWSVLPLAVTVGNLALLAVIANRSALLVGINSARRRAAVCGLVAAAPWSEPVFTTLRLGQINLLLLALVLWDFTQPASSPARGVGVGLAAAIKITPAIFIGYLLVTRRRRDAATALATVAATMLIAALANPSASWRFWTTSLFDTDRVGRVENAVNQSVRGLLARMDHTRAASNGELLFIAAVGVIGLGCAATAHRRLGDAWGVPACAVTGLLVSPISWSHHWVWCLPIALLLWHEARRFFPIVLIFWSYAVWALPHRDSQELRYSPAQITLSAWYVVFGAAFLALTASRIWDAATHTSPNTSAHSRGGAAATSRT
jgi:alpha-1,2-mannosyltransferase